MCARAFLDKRPKGYFIQNTASIFIFKSGGAVEFTNSQVSPRLVTREQAQFLFFFETILDRLCIFVFVFVVVVYQV